MKTRKIIIATITGAILALGMASAATSTGHAEASAPTSFYHG